MILTRVLSIVGVAILGALVGCASPTADEEEAGEEADAIVGGKSSGDRRVMLIAWTAGIESRVCSSVLIAPDVLLTAAHCVDPRGSAIFQATSDASVDYQSLDSSSLVQITSVERHPSYDRAHPERGHDIAVAFLKRPITDVQPFSLAPFTLPAAWSDAAKRALHPVNARIVGYGTTSRRDDPNRAGRRREALVPVRGLQAQTILLGDGAAGQACVNDSGGPALLSVKGQELVISVASFVSAAGKLCTTGNFGTRIDENWSFLKAKLGARLPAELQPAPADFPGAAP